MNHLRVSSAFTITFAAMFAVCGVRTASAADIKATGCFLSLKDQALVPARERGQLKEIHVEPGDEVETSQVMALLHDDEARLDLQLAKIDLSVAQKRNSESVAVEIADAALQEAAKLTDQARLDFQISTRMAESDITVRQAQAAGKLARDAYDRAVKSQEKFGPSVSSREMATVQYDLDKTTMDVEQAKYDQSLQQTRASSQGVLVEHREIAGRRLSLALDEARLEQGISELMVQRISTSVEVAAEKVDRLQIRSPLTGVVVEKMHHVGEWVEAGDPVLRVIRLNVLFVEGFADADLVDQSFRGHKVSVVGHSRGRTVTVTGQLVFVSPEIDSLNNQTKVRAEINNDQLQLKPGQKVEMTISAD